MVRSTGTSFRHVLDLRKMTDFMLKVLDDLSLSSQDWSELQLVIVQRISRLLKPDDGWTLRCVCREWASASRQIAAQGPEIRATADSLTAKLRALSRWRACNKLTNYSFSFNIEKCMSLSGILKLAQGLISQVCLWLDSLCARIPHVRLT